MPSQHGGTLHVYGWSGSSQWAVALQGFKLLILEQVRSCIHQVVWATLFYGSYFKKLSELGYTSEEFGLHSLHGRGTSVGANTGVPDCLFKKHGRWKSEDAKDGYIEDSLDAQLSVSRQIGLWHLCTFLQLYVCIVLFCRCSEILACIKY